MTKYIEFALNHWQLSGLFIILLVTLIVLELRKQDDKKAVSPEELINLYNHQHAVLLDIRSKEQFEQGHIVGAIHLDDIKSIDKKVKRFNKKTLVLIGGREAKQISQAEKLLKDKGCEQVFHLANGFSSWTAAGLPVKK